MKNATLLCLVLTALGAGFLAGFSYSQREQVSAASFAAAAPAKAGSYEGGHDHHMAMAESSAAPPGAVTVSPSKQQLIGVHVGTAEQKAATSRLRLYGRVVAEETRLYTLNVGIDGFIRQISNVTTGSHVRKDEWLATFSAPEARLPIQGYLVALDVLDRETTGGASGAALEQARGSVQQSVDRLLTLGMSSVQVEEIARTRQLPTNIRVTAPEDGFVVARRVSIGQKFERGDELYRIADLRRVWILADVFGRDAELVRPGMDAEVSLPGRTRTLRARTSGDVLPQFDQASQSLKVRLEVDNPDFFLRPGMFVDVELPITFPTAIVVPVEAVLDSGVRKTVFVERGPGVFEPRAVETGWRSGGVVEIVTGLASGDRIVVSGTFLLDSESRIRR
jgi:membrane fusion protein, copper/silver efflux system